MSTRESQQVQYRCNQASPNVKPAPLPRFKLMHVVRSTFYGKKCNIAFPLSFCWILDLHLKKGGLSLGMGGPLDIMMAKELLMCKCAWGHKSVCSGG